MEADIINAFSWMLYDGIIDMRFAIPCEKLEEGDFHDKFGIFYKGQRCAILLWLYQRQQAWIPKL